MHLKNDVPWEFSSFPNFHTVIRALKILQQSFLQHSFWYAKFRNRIFMNFNFKGTFLFFTKGHNIPEWIFLFLVRWCYMTLKEKYYALKTFSLIFEDDEKKKRKQLHWLFSFSFFQYVWPFLNDGLAFSMIDFIPAWGSLTHSSLYYGAGIMHAKEVLMDKCFCHALKNVKEPQK